MSESEVDLLERELGVELPTPYRAWLLRLPKSFHDECRARIWSEIGHVFNTPEAILEANLSLSDSSWLEDTDLSYIDLSDYLAVGGDGCGNYSIVELSDDESPVTLLSHDPVGIEDAFPSIDTFCESVDRVIKG